MPEHPPAGRGTGPLAAPSRRCSRHETLSHHPWQPNALLQARPRRAGRTPAPGQTPFARSSAPQSRRGRACRKPTATRAPEATRSRCSEPARPAVSKARLERDGTAASQGHEELAVVAGVAAIAAAGIIWRLDWSRREQLHSRPRGRLIPQNRPAVQAVERRARAIASEEAMRWVDFGLRYLSGLVEQQSFDKMGAVPSVVLVHAGKRGLEVLVSPAVQGPLGGSSRAKTGRGCSSTRR